MFVENKHYMKTTNINLGDGIANTKKKLDINNNKKSVITELWILVSDNKLVENLDWSAYITYHVIKYTFYINQTFLAFQPYISIIKKRLFSKGRHCPLFW